MLSLLDRPSIPGNYVRVGMIQQHTIHVQCQRSVPVQDAPFYAAGRKVRMYSRGAGGGVVRRSSCHPSVEEEFVAHHESFLLLMYPVCVCVASSQLPTVHTRRLYRQDKDGSTVQLTTTAPLIYTLCIACFILTNIKVKNIYILNFTCVIYRPVSWLGLVNDYLATSPGD